MGMGDLRLGEGEVDAERPFRGEVFLPGEFADSGVERLRGRRGEARQGKEDAAGGARPEAGAVAERQRTAKGDSGPAGIDRRGAEGAQFGRQQGFHPSGGSGEEVQGGGHVSSRTSLSVSEPGRVGSDGSEPIGLILPDPMRPQSKTILPRAGGGHSSKKRVPSARAR